MISYDERDQLRDAVRGLIRDRAPMRRVRELMDGTACDRDLWSTIAKTLAGSAWAELAVALEEVGRSVTPVPLLTTHALAMTALTDAGHQDLADEVASGDVIATVAWMEGGGWTQIGGGTHARRDGDAYQLSGVKDFVIDGHVADLVLVLCSDGMFATRHFVATALATLDQTRQLARVEFDDAPARQLADATVIGGLLDRMLDAGRIALAAEMLGGAQACLDMAVAYAKTRQQFGRPIGSFQAIKHMCAEVLVQVESTRALVEAASAALDDQPERAHVLAPVAKAYAAETFVRAAGDNLQIHGGIGFTWEHDAHIYLKRAKASDLIFGEASAQRALVADRLGL